MIFCKKLTKSEFSCDSQPPNCQDPACSSKQDLFKKIFNNIETHKKYDFPENPLKNDSQSDNRNENDEDNQFAIQLSQECPLDREELGRSTWELIHTVAANYPDFPDEIDIANARSFITSLSHLYPCKMCAKDFADYIKNNPPKVDRREDFVLWCCHQHNEVNEKLGKPLFPCEIVNLDKRWKKGSKECGFSELVD